jgi:hypothetical protein
LIYSNPILNNIKEGKRLNVVTQKLDLALLLAVFGVHKTNRIEGRTRTRK